jgi:hypothetical protein
MKRALLLLSTILTALTVVAVANANTPYRVVNPAPGDETITGQCAFPVLAHIEGSEINTTFFDKDGNPVKLLGVFPGNTLTLTNLDDPDKSITFLGSTSSFHLRAEHDGSVIAMVTGQGWWPMGNPITGEPGIWYQEGRSSATYDAEGNLVSLSSAGKLVDLCPQLSS